MSNQFACKSVNRRDQLRGQTAINGIDYLEVLDNRAQAIGSPRQRTLLVRLFQAWPVVSESSDSVRIEGGVRVRGIQVQWAYRADAAAIPATIDEKKLLATLPAQDHVLVVRTDEFGDASTYTLTVLDPLRRVPPVFDPITSSVDFSFKAECPSDFDCAPANDCAPLAGPPPPIDYLAKDYASFRRVILDRLSVIMPDWQERNAADLNVALVEIVAYAADYLSYYQDAVATEAYLGTARQRVSVRRHARLLDYFMHEGTGARAWLCLEVDAQTQLTARPTPPLLPTAFLTRVSDATLLDPSYDSLQQLIRAEHPQVFEPLHDVVLYPLHNQIRFHTWQDEQCCLPKGATRATLREPFDPKDPSSFGQRLLLRAGDVLIFEELLGGADKLAPDADPVHRQAVRLTKVVPEATLDQDGQRGAAAAVTDLLTGEGVVDIEWHSEDALTFPLCVSALVNQIPVEDVSAARGNVLLVDQGKTWVEPVTGPASTDRRYRPTLLRPEVTHAPPFDTDFMVPQADGTPPISAAASMIQDAHAAVPQVALYDPTSFDPSLAWSAVPDLLESGPFERQFVAELQSNGFATLRFGDGILGRAPETSFSAYYRTGRGRSGNVGAEAISHIAISDTAFRTVRNPLPATGGVEPESLEEVRQYAPQAFRVQERAVTEIDYGEIAQRFPDVDRALATRRWTGSWYTVFVTVDRKGGRELDDRFSSSLLAFLENYRMAGEDLELEPPLYVPLDVRLVACVKPGYFRDQVQQALMKAFDDRDHSDGSRGFFHPDDFTFGTPVYLSAVIARAMQVAGVEWVDPADPEFVFQRYGEIANGEIAAGVITLDRLEVARLQNSLSLPENGRLRFKLMGGK